MKKVKKANTRDKAWLGAVIGGVANIATSLISSYQQEQAQKKELAAQQRMQQQQNIANANIAAQQQAGAMTNALANQNYVDEYKNKIVMKNGGFYDRLSKDKAIFKCGGKKKKAAGGIMDGGKGKNKKKTNNGYRKVVSMKDSNGKEYNDERMRQTVERAINYHIINPEYKPFGQTNKNNKSSSSKRKTSDFDWEEYRRKGERFEQDVKDYEAKVHKEFEEFERKYLNERKKKSMGGEFPQFKCGGKKKKKC